MRNRDNRRLPYHQFLDIIESKSSLQPLADSQVMDGINTFLNLALEYSLHRVERARQDSYLTTALNRSSILALSEDRQYVPRKSAPSSGSFKVVNSLGDIQSVPANTLLVSEGQIYYMTGDAVMVFPNNRANGQLKQLRPETVEFRVTEERPFLEFELDKSLSRSIAQMTVYVDMGQGFVEWEKSVRFRNTDSYSLAYDEFYSHTDQVGIRFGNGIFGKIPAPGSRVRVDLMLTEGDTKLMPNQPLYPIEPERFTGLEFFSAGTVTGGQAQEDTEEIRKNALYYTLYNEEVVWNGDYVFYIKRHHPTINWLNVWGEQEMEEMTGAPNASYINKIFFTAHAPRDRHINKKILASLEKLPPLNRQYQAIEREDHSFVVKIEGKLDRSILLADATSIIGQLLRNNYDQLSPERRTQVHIRDLYALMNSAGIFASDQDIHINITGKTTPDNLKQMLFIDLEESMEQLKLTY